ncbi:hypothetical protein EJ069_10305 [Mesorhizobium sp. M2A.F.Ca.ET.043.05.1.1]|uniref:hypothetical protein n=1 Tax=Mesorhizobium sp. M2A.F.Ca.ET.043.05.1.1 TaxID=2493671 RepID=UPI000F75A56A|nr:hypothetical protein [Mesorhizobium sp. M2A.F.Ca.ET.043.05.1.1]AZO15086.1 hypothetical protein EJ069_10305 [Mesorhizobium sp. M2A.F.Ca.ET.043.05.1.1]
MSWQPSTVEECDRLLKASATEIAELIVQRARLIVGVPDYVPTAEDYQFILRTIVLNAMPTEGARPQ